MFMCNNCKHKNVCKNIEEFEKSIEICKDFDNSNNPEVYGNIYDMFQPIFEWIQAHYPSGEMFFVVDSMSAKMFHEHKVNAYDKRIKEIAQEATKKAFGEKDE